MDVIWDRRKAASNLTKHGVTFQDAEAALYDPRALVREDPDAEDEQRFVLTGADAEGRILTLVYAYRDPEGIRLISARRATAKERENYAR